MGTCIKNIYDTDQFNLFPLLLLSWYNIHKKGWKMTIEEIKEKKEELEYDIQRLLMVFERNTGSKIEDVGITVGGLLSIDLKCEVRDMKICVSMKDEV